MDSKKIERVDVEFVDITIVNEEHPDGQFFGILATSAKGTLPSLLREFIKTHEKKDIGAMVDYIKQKGYYAKLLPIRMVSINDLKKEVHFIGE